MISPAGWGLLLTKFVQALSMASSERSASGISLARLRPPRTLPW